MQKTDSKNLEQLVREELLPVYLEYHKQHTLETPREVLDYMASAGLYKPKQIPALLKPKNY